MFVWLVPKISQVKKKRRRRALQLGRFTLCGTTAAELLHHSVDLLWAQRPPRYYTLNSVRFTLCGATTAQLHNSVDLLCGTTAAELNNPVSLMHAPGVAHIFQRQ